MDVCEMLVSGKPGAAWVPVLAAGLAVVAWLGKSCVSGFLYYFARYSDQIEMLSALKAEIAIIVDHVDGQEGPGLVADLAAKYQKDEDHKLFMPLYRDTIVFDALKTDVTAITERSLKQVIAFYNLSGGLDALQSAMTTERFETFQPERRVDIFRRFLDRARETADAGRRSIAIVENELSIVKARRAFISLASAGVFGLGAVFVGEGVQTVSNCAGSKAASANRSYGPRIAGAFRFSDERGQDRPHVTPRMRNSGANDNHNSYIAAIAPGFNPKPARDRFLGISGGRHAAA